MRTQAPEGVELGLKTSGVFLHRHQEDLSSGELRIVGEGGAEELPGAFLVLEAIGGRGAPEELQTGAPGAEFVQNGDARVEFIPSVLESVVVRSEAVGEVVVRLRGEEPFTTIGPIRDVPLSHNDQRFAQCPGTLQCGLEAATLGCDLLFAASEGSNLLFPKLVLDGQEAPLQQTPDQPVGFAPGEFELGRKSLGFDGMFIPAQCVGPGDAGGEELEAIGFQDGEDIFEGLGIFEAMVGGEGRKFRFCVGNNGFSDRGQHIAGSRSAADKRAAAEEKHGAEEERAHG